MTLTPSNSHPLGLPLGLTGATGATRYVGATASGAPATGAFAVGDFVIDQSGAVYVCTAAGSPGTWTATGGGGIVQAAQVSITSGDLTTASTTFVDATGVTVTITTGAHRCIVITQCNVTCSLGNNPIRTDIAVDGTRQGQGYGLGFYQEDNSLGGANSATPITNVILTGVLTAAAHTFKLQWNVSGGTGTMWASTAITPARLIVLETSLSV